MLLTIIEKISNTSLDIVDSIANKIGLLSIGTSAGVVASQEVSPTIQQVILQSNWLFSDYALLISLIGGSLFIVEKLIVIYLRIREAARLEKDNKK